MIEYRIDRRSGVAAYVQIVQQTEQALRMGTLRAGDKLPTAKEVVAATAINPNTVLKAYRELERAGLVEARRGLGTFVRRSLARPESDAGSVLRAELADWVARARAAGLDRADVRALFADALADHERDDHERDEEDRPPLPRRRPPRPASHDRPDHTQGEL